MFRLNVNNNQTNEEKFLMPNNQSNQLVNIKDLEIISEISSNILSNLSLEQILQSSIDHIVARYNFLGGLLFLINKNYVYTKTIAGGNKAVENFINVIGKPISNLKISLDATTNNFVVNSVLTKQVYFSYELEDFTRGVLNKPLSYIAKNVTNTKSCICLPIIYQENVLGALYFCKSRHEDFSAEMPILNILSNHIGIAINNAKLYSRLEKSALNLRIKNAQLTQALSTVTDLRRQEKDMMDIVAHELRNPITAVYGVMQILKHLGVTEPTRPLSDYIKYIDVGYSSATKEIELIETLLAATKLESKEFVFELQEFDLVSLLNTSIKEISSLYKDKPIVSKFSTELTTLNVKADRIRVAEIIDNLITNAFKYTVKGHVHIKLAYFNEELILTIEDTGIGIDSKDIANLGKKFFRANARNKQGSRLISTNSTGLGLYIVYSLMKRLGGSISVTNNDKDGGSIFNLTFKKNAYFSW